MGGFRVDGQVDHDVVVLGGVAAQDCGGGSCGVTGRDPHVGSVRSVVAEPGQRGVVQGGDVAVLGDHGAETVAGETMPSDDDPVGRRDVDVGVAEAGGDGDGAVDSSGGTE